MNVQQLEHLRNSKTTDKQIVKRILDGEKELYEVLIRRVGNIRMCGAN